MLTVFARSHYRSSFRVTAHTHMHKHKVRIRLHTLAAAKTSTKKRGTMSAERIAKTTNERAGKSTVATPPNGKMM